MGYNYNQNNKSITITQKHCVDVNTLGDLLWSGALDRWNDADDETREAVFERIIDWSSDFSDFNPDGEPYPDLEWVNDTIWFECDDLFFPDEDEDEEDEEEDEEEEE